MSKKELYTGLIVAIALPLALSGQEQPLSVTGTFSSGYYSTYSRGDSNQSLSYVPLGAKFEMTGYYISPDLINFTAAPELNLGPQASEAGFQGGNGIRLRVTFLRKRILPMTFRYSNVQVEDVYFGSLSQLSGYTLKNRNKDLGMTWVFKPTGLPITTVDWATDSVDSKSDTAGISDYKSSGNHINADTSWCKWNWDMAGFFHHQKQASDLLEAVDGSATTGTLVQKVTQYQFSAQRNFLQDSNLHVEGGSLSTSMLLFTLPIDLTTHYASANLRLFQKRRWRGSIRGNYSSNINSQLLEQATSTLAGQGTLAPDGNLLLPYSNSTSSFNVNGITNVDLFRGIGLFASVERSAVISSSQEAALNASFTTATGGVTYAGKYRWGNLSGEYSRQYGIGSVTGQSGTIQGQNYSVNAQHRRSGGLEFDGTVHGSDQSVRNVQPLSIKSFSAEGSVAGRVYHDFSVRVGGGYQRSSFVNSENEFRTNGFMARAAIEHPKFQISASINDSLSNSLPFYSQLFTGLGVGSVLVAPLQIIPSDYRALNFTLHTNPLRKVEISAIYTRSLQHLDGYLSNDFEFLSAYAKYHYRRIELEFGFIHSNQVFSNYPTSVRQRVYVKVSRTAKLL